MMASCNRSECLTTAGCGHRGPRGEMCWLRDDEVAELRAALAAKDAELAKLREALEPFAVFPEAHFATFPPALIEPCILAGCPKGGIVLDPFGGAGTTGLVADRLGRNAILIELNPEYAAMAERRIQGDAGMFASVSLTSAERK
jgi:hypothetical protein